MPINHPYVSSVPAGGDASLVDSPDWNAAHSLPTLSELGITNTQAIEPTGTADDVVIQAAIDALGATGGTVLLAPGTFAVTATITVPSNVTLYAETGAIIVTAAGGYSVFKNDDYAGVTGNENIRLIGLVVDDAAQADDNSGRGIVDFANVHRVQIDRCALLNSHTTGISVWSGGGTGFRNTHIRITNNHVENPRGTTNGAGISLGKTDYYVVANNTFKDITGSAACIGPDESTFGTITGNTGDNVRDGIVLEGTATPPTDTTIAGNTFQGNDPTQSGWGIAIRELGTRNVVVGNTLRDFNTGVRLMGVSENSIESNYVSHCTASGILLMDEGGFPCKNNIVNGNTSVDNDYGIRAINASNENIYTNNVLLRNFGGKNLVVVGADNTIHSNHGHEIASGPQHPTTVQPTGTADDVNVQAAIDALGATGGEVILAPGTWLFAAPVQWTTSHVVVKGVGPGTRITQNTGLGAGRAFFEVGDGVTYPVRSGVENLRIEGGRGTQTQGRGVWIRGRDCWAKNVIAQDTPEDAFLMGETSGTTIHDNLFEGCRAIHQGAVGFIVEATSSDGRLINCIVEGGSLSGTVTGTGTHGFHVKGGSTWCETIHAYYNANHGLLNDTNGDITVVNSIFESNVQKGIHINGVHDASVTNNKIYANDRNATDGAASHESVLLTNSLRSRVIGNQFRKVISAAPNVVRNIFLSGSNHCIITDNECVDAQTDHINLTNSDYNIVQGNNIRDGLTYADTNGITPSTAIRVGGSSEHNIINGNSAGQAVKENGDTEDHNLFVNNMAPAVTVVGANSVGANNFTTAVV